MTRLRTIPPTEQVYRSHVPSQYHGFPIEKYFAARFAYQTEDQWIRLILNGKIAVNGETAVVGQPVREQDLAVTQMGLRTEPAADRNLSVVYQDRQIRAFNKGAPIPVHPCGRYFKNTMTEILKLIYPQEVPRPIQRLDATTTGLIVFARTREAAAFIMTEFQENRVHKEYLALVEGVPRSGQFTIDAPIGKLKGSKRGVGEDTLRSQSARTDVEWLRTIGGRSLLKVIPRSGRTNQIRVHLASVGLPIYNDSVYGKGRDSRQEYGLHHRRMRFRCLDTILDLTASCPNHFQPFIESVSDEI
ncbi:hypothetical protein UR09_03535 [Candidatus Nitromaritima sp. SCGC AAA799-A02]|nr:hypothetical protein UR09_03535 [Candidatus Nitromaritima sp. SCGC AAA799-A02]